MEFRQLTEKDAKQFSELIVNMYANLENLEWFTPMPFDIESARGIITNPRFYVLGAFDGERLAGISSLDYKCGKLIGKIDFPKECDTEKLVEIGFTIVHTDYRGRKIMQQLIKILLDKLRIDDYTWAFTKVHENNIASNKSCFNTGFKPWRHYSKPVSKEDFANLSNEPFFSKAGKINADKTLDSFKNEAEIIANYNISVQRL